MNEKAEKTTRSQGAPAAVAGRAFAEGSREAIREGFKSNEAQLIDQGVPVVPHLSRDEALVDESKRQSSDDKRREAFRKAEAAAAEAAEKARRAATEGL